MRRLTRILAALLLAALVAAMACGRRGSDVVTVAALLEADTLLSPAVDNADSALAVLRSVDTAALATDGDRALYALLITQALYKTKQGVVDSSFIINSVDYYAANAPGSKRHIQAVISSGIVDEAKGNIQSALYKYKTAELSCDTNMHFDIGYADMKIANIYHKYTIDHPATINYYRKAVSHLAVAGKRRYWLYCLSDLGAIYRMTSHQDSALYFLTMAHDAAVERGDSFMITDTEVYLTGYYYHIKDYRDALEYAKMIGKRPGKFDQYPLVPLFAAMSYAKLHYPDSAEVYLKLASVRNAADSVSYYAALSYIAEERGDSIAARLYMADCDSINDSHILRNAQKNTANGEMSASIKYVKSIEGEMRSRLNLGIYALAAAVLVLLALLVLFFYRRRIIAKRNQYLEDQLSLLNKEYCKIDSLLNSTKEQILLHGSKTEGNSSSAVEIERLCITLKAQCDLLMTAVRDIFAKKGDKSRFNNINDYTIKASLEIDDLFWNRVSSITEELFPHMKDAITQAIPDIEDSDMKFLLLKCLKFPDLLICIYNGLVNTRSAANKLARLRSKICPSMSFEEWLKQFSALDKIENRS